MPRQSITERRLISRMNEALAGGVDCCDHEVSGVMRVEKDDRGCNWSISVMSCFGPFSSAGNREAERIIKAMQRLYNLYEESVTAPVKVTSTSNRGVSA
jgi:hypothetical protein